MSAAPQAAESGAFLHGTSGFLLVYLIATGAVLVGRVLGRVPFKLYLWLPFDGIIVLVVAGLATGLLELVLPHWLAIGIGIVLGLPFAYFYGRGDPYAPLGPTRLRGAIIGAHGLSRRGRRPKAADGQLTLAGVLVPPLDETKHFKLIGTTGTGKTTAIRELLQGALRRGDRAVVADPEGGYLDQFYDPKRGDLILNPFDPISQKWDLFAEIKNPYDFEQIARSLIPDGFGEDRVFRQYAQTFLTSALRQTHGSGIRDSAELYRLLASAPPDELRVLLEGTPAQPFVAAGNEKMFGSVRSVTTSAIASLSYINTQTSPLFSLRTWVKEGRGVLFLPYRADQIAALHAIISTWLRIAVFETMNLPEGDARLWFIVDELDALGPIDGLKDALPRLRKFGGRCVLGFQSIAQVSGTYGRANGETIVENCGNTLILRCSASEGGGTAQFASRLIGEREIIRDHISKSRAPGDWFSTTTTSKHHITESAVLPAEIEQLPDLCGFLKMASDPIWRPVQLNVIRATQSVESC
jgi:type IV secretory pathway TraG/TraD family ATPase VirD4